MISKIKSIKKIGKREVYDIINVNKNNNYIANNLVVHNSENKDLKRKLAEIRTKHFLFILNFPLKISKIEKTYLDSYCNYWIDLYARGKGVIYIKDRNPLNDAWRMKDFTKLGSYNEFTEQSKIEKVLSKHPNFWQMITFPKPPDWLYARYLKVREKNVYDDENVLSSVSNLDVQNALLVLALRDVMMNDVNMSVNRILLHIRNNYDIPITKKAIENAIEDAKQLVQKIREEGMNVLSKNDGN